MTPPIPLAEQIAAVERAKSRSFREAAQYTELATEKPSMRPIAERAQDETDALTAALATLRGLQQRSE